VETIRKTWKMLGENIYIGERYERNMKSIAVLSVIMGAAGLVMLILNLSHREYTVAMTAVPFMVTGGVTWYFTVYRRNRRAAMILSLAAVVMMLTYNVLFLSNGFAFLWTILVPLAVSYLFGARPGILVSGYFTVLYFVLFYTPLRSLVEQNYSAVVMDRFPILYFFLFIITAFVMVQYHRSVLDQMNYAAQLQRARDDAEQANRAKGDFLAEMSHEIRTPINAVLGMNEMIRRESKRGEVETADGAGRDSFRSIYSCASNIENAGNSLLSIINDILDFSKIEAGRMTLVENDYELRALLQDLSSTVLFRAREKGLAYRVDADPDLPNGLYGDKVRVRQVITNLLTNAVKYTDRGEIRLEVRGRRKEDPAGNSLILQMTVRDTGIGIRQEDIPSIFTKFQRVDLDRNSTVEGTGLGLAITRSLLDMMGGTISVQSTYGEGSAFTVCLPQRIVSAEPLGDVRTEDLRAGQAGNLCRETFRAPDARILAVDDSRMNLAVVSGLLKNTDVQIDTAQRGREALDLLKRVKYDLILMDQRMPGMDGTEVLRLLREMEDSPSRDAPVVCLTADAIIGAKERYTAQGFTDYLAKPVSGEMLEKTLLRYLPAEKVLRRKEETEKQREDAGSDPARAGLYALLRRAGIDPEQGLMYCREDEELYRTLLGEFSAGAGEKQQRMQAFLDAGDWDNYGILVHSLKSTAATIGATALSAKAAALEKAAKEKQADVIRLNHPNLLESYLPAAEAAARAAGPAEQEVQPENGILEFPPDE